jgi:membrane-associated protein
MMDLLHQFKDTILNPQWLIEYFGPYAYLGLALIVFLETGALVFFLPGDSLLFVAGLFSAPGEGHHLNIFALNAILIVCAVVGDATSYSIGKKLGQALFNRKDSKLLKPEHLDAAREFYEKHGGKAIILARFVPVVRTFVPVVAGAAQMSYRQFATYNIVGGAAWVISMTTAGYFLGQIQLVAKNLEKVVVLIVLLSVVPIIIEYVKARRASAPSA